MFSLRNSRAASRRNLAKVAILLALVGSLPRLAAGDDRDLVRARSAEPYVFILFDVSGSMNWQPGGDLFAFADGDDPNSKFYQAKSALFKVLTDPDLTSVDIHWGFATYNQDTVRLYRKHWVYTPLAVPAMPWASDLAYPKAGELKYFGDHCQRDKNGTTCDLDADDILGACTTPTNFSTAEGKGEVLTYPVLGDNFNIATTEYVLYNGRRFELVWNKVSGNLGDDNIVVSVRVREKSTNSSCTTIKTYNLDLPFTITFTRAFAQDNNQPTPRALSGASDFINWQIDGPPSSAAPNGFDDFGNPNGFWDPTDSTAGGTCNGWEPNDSTTGTDDDAGVLLKYQTKDDPLNRHATAFDRGDVIPLDWKDTTAWAGQTAPYNLSNLDLILKRLAPNYSPASPTTVPDFRVAHYFQNHPDTLAATATAGRLALLSAYVDTPPLLPNGSTPIGNSMRNFMTWLDTWLPVAKAPTGDTEIGCRTINLIILTDGDETCYGKTPSVTDPRLPNTDDEGDANPCWIADQLTQSGRKVKTYVVGYGVPDASANFLKCISKYGCTGAAPFCNLASTDPVTKTKNDGPGPILPGNESDLVSALKAILVDIRGGSKSFASAAVPSVQANTQDKVVLSNFIPVDDQPIWPGHLDAYVKPVPTKEIEVKLPDGSVEKRIVPDRDKRCASDTDVKCRSWDGDEELIKQAATSGQITDGSFNLGVGAGERRQYLAQPSASGTLPATRLSLKAPATSDSGGWNNLLSAMGICTAGDMTCSGTAANRTTATKMLQYVHRLKQYEDPAKKGTFINYMLGDIFHSDPLVTGEPANFRYFTSDLYQSSGCGYRCFFQKHQNRRKILLVGSDDGELHAFDAGTPEIKDGKLKVSNGTGRELFGFVPRPVFPRLKTAADDYYARLSNPDYKPAHTFKTDGSPVVADVFIDPKAGDGTGREWRTVVLGGLREGGRGYYALDITQPDTLTTNATFGKLPEPLGGSPKYVPSCSADEDGGPDCGPLPYPAVLWEFQDLCGTVSCDDDLNGKSDLGDTWSTPNIGRIRLCTGSRCNPAVTPNDLIDRFVAVFGGGMDSTLANQRGNWLYMVDIETGKVLYKRALDGSAPSEPAAVDTDLDGYLDTVYIGTVKGFLYKVDMRVPPLLVNLTGIGQRVDPAAWAPFKIFDTETRPIYYPPAVLFVANKGQYALSFGTGDREDLWRTTTLTGRFFTILDESFTTANASILGLPFKAIQYPGFTATGAVTAGTDFLNVPASGKHPGWYLDLDVGERIITKSFALSGVTIFSSFQPRPTTEAIPAGGVCGSAGTSRIFVANTVNSAGFLGGTTPRFRTVQDFVTSPYTELGQTKNQLGGKDDPDSLTTAERTRLNQVMAELQKLFPKNCRFANYTINIKAVRADTGLEFLAPVPVCVVEKNWKEF